MEQQERNGLEASREQVIYANLLLVGVWLGMLILVVTFGLYVLQILAPHVPVADTPRYWGKGVAEYLTVTRWPCGWSWVTMLHKGDVLNYIGLVLLALLTIVGYTVLLVAYLRERSRLFSLICVLEIIVLGLAASGILAGGGH